MNSKRRRAPRRPSPARRRPRGAGTGRLFWLVLGSLVVVGAVVVLVVALSDDADDVGAEEIAADVQVTGSSLPVLQKPADDPGLGRTAPVLEGVGFDDQPVATPTPGRPFVVVFLAHWCPHCQAEVPRIVSLAEAGGTDGVDVLGVATGTNPDAPNHPPSEWLSREDWPFPVLLDTAESAAASSYGLGSYPLLVFVDSNGEVAARVAGEVAQSDLAEMFAAVATGEPVTVPGAGPASQR